MDQNKEDKLEKTEGVVEKFVATKQCVNIIAFACITGDFFEKIALPVQTRNRSCLLGLSLGCLCLDRFPYYTKIRRAQIEMLPFLKRSWAMSYRP